MLLRGEDSRVGVAGISQSSRRGPRRGAYRFYRATDAEYLGQPEEPGAPDVPGTKTIVGCMAKIGELADGERVILYAKVGTTHGGGRRPELASGGGRGVSRGAPGFDLHAYYGRIGLQPVDLSRAV